MTRTETDPSGTDVRPPAIVDVTIPAPPEVVWRALTDATELMRWFPVGARVEPGPGSPVWLAWDQEEWKMQIELWEPPRHLRWVESKRDAQGHPVLLAVDFHLAGSGGETVLRVVHSGFGRGAEWDREYDGVLKGWSYELRSLREYVRYHLGKDRAVAWARVPTALSEEEAYGRVMGPEGLLREGSVANLHEGDPYRIVTATGDVLEGRLLRRTPGKEFSAVVDNWNHGLLRFMYWDNIAWLWLATYGVDADKLKAFEQRWTERLTALLAS